MTVSRPKFPATGGSYIRDPKTGRLARQKPDAEQVPEKPKAATSELNSPAPKEPKA